MAKQKIKHEGPGFVVLKAAKKNRRRVQTTYRNLTGQRASTQLMVRYTHADQFPEYLLKRIHVTTFLARYMLYYRFIWEQGPVSVYVSGAEVQIGRGTSRPPTRGEDGGVIYNGLDASHVRLGTYSVNGDAISLIWPARIMDLADSRGIPRKLVNEAFPANVSMAAVAMMYDAATDYTDALLNRVFGKVEDYTHRAMRTLIPSNTPTSVTELEQVQIRFTENFPGLIAKMMKRYARERNRQLQLPKYQEARQEQGLDVDPPMFERETEILDAMISELDNGESETMRSVDAMITRSRNDIRDEIADAVSALDEVTG